MVNPTNFGMKDLMKIVDNTYVYTDTDDVFEPATTTTGVIMVPPKEVKMDYPFYANLNLKVGNLVAAIKPHMKQVSVSVNPSHEQMYPSSKAWKDAIKNEIALLLAQQLVDAMDFVQMSSADGPNAIVTGRVFTLTETELKSALKSQGDTVD